MTLPYIFFAVAVTAALGNGLVQAMSAIGILLAPGFFRVTRAATLEFARAQYVEAAELLGASKLHVIRVHVVRKVLPTIAVTTAMAVGGGAAGGVLPHLPRHRRAAARPDLGRRALLGPRLPVPGALGAVHPRRADRHHRGRAQRAGRRVPGPAGPGALPLSDPVIKTHSTLDRSHIRRPPMPGNPPPDEVLGLDGPAHHRARRGRHRGPRHLAPVGRGRDRRPGRRVGQRQDAGLPGRSRRAAAGLRHRRRARSRSRART